MTIATVYYPYDAGPGANVSEDQWRTMTGNTNSHGVINGFLNELAVTGDSTGMQIKLATGGCWINGAYGQNSTLVQTISLAASHATLNRFDLIVARNNYTTNVIEWAVIQGTNAASPTIPTVTTDPTRFEIALAYVYVAATVTTIAAANVTDQRPYNIESNRFYRRFSLNSLSDTISIDNLPARKNLKFRVIAIASGQISLTIRFNNDSGSNYAIRQSANGGAEATAGSQTSLIIYSPGTRQSLFYEMELKNITAQEKIGFGLGIDGGTAGAASFAGKAEQSVKWANTAAPITRIDILNTGTGDYAIGSELIVEGYN